jgi:hypothetical protein
VTGVDAADFAAAIEGNLSGAQITNVSGTGTTYTVTVGNYTGAGTIRLDVLDDDSIINAGSVPLGCAGAGNGDFAAGDAYTILPVCTPPPAGMVAWYAGDGDATDLIGSNNGAFVGEVNFRNGKVAQAFDFSVFRPLVRNVREAATGYVAIEDAPEAALDLTGDMTLDAWVRLPFSEGEESGGSDGTIISKQSLDGANVSYQLAISDGQLRFSAANAQDETSGALVAPTPLPAGEFTHVAATIENVSAGETGVNAVLRLYVNGDLVATDNDFQVVRPDTTGRLTIGATETSAGSGAAFSGLIDEVELFNRALSQDEIRAIVAADTAGKCKPAQVTTEDDAYVRGATPTENFGASPELQVKRTLNPGNGKGRQAYLRFDTSRVEGGIERAILRVYGGLNAVNEDNVNIPGRGLSRVRSRVDGKHDYVEQPPRAERPVRVDSPLRA